MNFEDLYQEVILDHYRNPRNKANLDHIPDEKAHENPTCGDSLKLEVLVDCEDRVEQVRFDGHGCAISVASASMMTEIVKGLSCDKVLQLAETIPSALRGDPDTPPLDNFGDIAALGGVQQFPLRIKCATLAWHALANQLNQREHDT